MTKRDRKQQRREESQEEPQEEPQEKPQEEIKRPIKGKMLVGKVSDDGKFLPVVFDEPGLMNLINEMMAKCYKQVEERDEIIKQLREDLAARETPILS